MDKNKLSNTLKDPGLLQRPRYHLLLIIVVIVLIYSNTFQVPFHFDDKYFIFKNPLVINLDYLSGSKFFEERRYVAFFTFSINYLIHKLDVTGYHVVNLFIHIANALMVYGLVILTFKTPFLKSSKLRKQASQIALVAGLFFACHPIQTQAVTYIYQRLTSLATLFYCLSLLMYIKWRLLSIQTRPKISQPHFLFYLGSVISAVLAMKTKEISFTLPVVITLYELMFFEGKFHKRFLYLLPLLLTMLIIPISILEIKKPVVEVISDVSEVTRLQTKMSRWVYLFTQFAVICTYIRLIFLPINQNIDYDYSRFYSFLNPRVFLSFAFLLMIFMFAVYMFFYSRTRNRPTRLIAFGIFWFFITLSVESSFIPIIDLIFEHRIYLPSVGVSMALSAGLFLVLNKFEGTRVKGVGVILMFLAISLLSVATYSRNNIWRSELSLWLDCLEKSPQKARPHFMVGNALKRKGRLDEAMDHYYQALRISPFYAKAHNNLGVALFEKGRFSEAVDHYLKALRIKPDYVDVHNNLGNTFFKQGRIDEAIEQYNKALRVQPNNSQFRMNLSRVLAQKGGGDSAIDQYLKTLRVNPDNEIAHYNVGILLAKKGEYDKAIEHLKAALRLKPDNANAQNNLGNCLLLKGNIQEAIVHYRKTLEIQPDHEFAQQNLKRALAKQKEGRNDTLKADIFFNQKENNPEMHYRKGNSFRNNGKLNEAIQQYQKALEIQPDFTPAINKIGLIYVAQGEYDKAFSSYQRIIELKPDDYVAYYNVACMYAKQNKIEEAVDWLKKAVKHGFRDWEFLKKDKDLENIRRSSYYKELTNQTK
jgi:tetratricopeptide (TPR) repeat protein